MIVHYFHPYTPIHAANLSVSYQHLDGTALHVEEDAVEIEEGNNSFVFWWTPAEHIPEYQDGQVLKAVILLTDYQGVEIAFEVVKFTLVGHAVNALLTSFADGSLSQNLQFAEPHQTQTVTVALPKEAKVKKFTLDCAGYDMFSSLPSAIAVRVGDTPDATWLMGESQLEGQVSVLRTFKNGQSEIDLPIGAYETKTVSLRIPCTAYVRDAFLTVSGHHSSVVHDFLYDDFEDGIVDLAKWEIYETREDSTVEETNGYLSVRVFSRTWAEELTSIARAVMLPPLDEIEELTFDSYYFTDIRSDLRARFDLSVLGNILYSINRSSSSASDAWTVVRDNEAEEGNAFHVWRNGEYHKHIIATNNDLCVGTYIGGRSNYGGDYTAEQRLFAVHYKQRSKPASPYVEIGECDGTAEWCYDGPFSGIEVTTDDFSCKLNECLTACMECQDGFCDVAVHVFSEREGEIRIRPFVSFINSRSIDLAQAINEYLHVSECEGCCVIPLHIISGSRGGVLLPRLNVVYEPTTCERANLDCIGRIDMQDFCLFAEQYLKEEASRGDMNADHIVDVQDWRQWSGEWLYNCACN